MAACYNGHIEVVKVLVIAGAALDTKAKTVGAVVGLDWGWGSRSSWRVGGGS